MHFFGNYTVQDLLDACGKFRAAAALLRERGGAPVEVVSALLGAQGGQDSLGARARTQQLHTLRCPHQFPCSFLGQRMHATTARRQQQVQAT